MGFFKNLFSKKDEPKGEQFIPTPTQEVSGIPPIVVQATENLFPDIDDQKSAFKCILELKERGKTPHDPRLLLALVSYSNGNIHSLRAAASQTHPHFWMEEISPIFPEMKNAEDWVKSITRTRT